jgi:hypothetical protein
MSNAKTNGYFHPVF